VSDRQDQSEFDVVIVGAGFADEPRAAPSGMNSFITRGNAI
jgi:ribulose 1,5-bisphosphate synthetase/thiazole synthase